MSKNIAIQEGGVARQLTVDKLKTNLAGSGTCMWVPEDGVRLGTKTITENGTYKASDDGYYGYSQVTVSGIGTVSGVDPATGEDVAVQQDPGTGEIVTTVLPHSIQIITPPTKLVYNNGEAIDLTWMVVKAYTANSQIWTDTTHTDGVIANSELTIDPTTATGTGSSGVEVEYTASDLEGQYNQNPIEFVTSLVWDDTNNPDHNPITITASSGYFLTVSNGYYYVSNTNAYLQYTGFDDYQVTVPVEATTDTIDGQQVTIAAKAITGNYAVHNPTYTGAVPNTVLRDMYRLMYMNKGTVVGAVNSISVNWNRPIDQKTLSTSFDITVS